MNAFKPLLSSLLLLTTSMPVILTPSTARAEVRLSFNYFEERLAPYGEWVTIADYGPCWHPMNMTPDWSPYQDGYWAYTDAGWTWISNEPFGEYVYHYGRWVLVDDLGWAWVPGYEWAPAWVSWRTSDDYVGWAPLPPEARWNRSTGFSVWTDQAYNIGPRYYRFCPVRDFGARDMRHSVRPWRENFDLFGLTVNITNINYDYDAGRVYAGGPSWRYLEGRTRDPVHRLRLVESRDLPRSVVSDEEYRYLRPPLAPNPIQGREEFTRRSDRKYDHKHVDRGWSGARDEAQRSKLQQFVADQARGRTPSSAPAKALPRSAGGLMPQQLERPGKDRGENRDKAERHDGDRPMVIKPATPPARVEDQPPGPDRRDSGKPSVPKPGKPQEQKQQQPPKPDRQPSAPPTGDRREPPAELKRGGGDKPKNNPPQAVRPAGEGGPKKPQSPPRPDNAKPSPKPKSPEPKPAAVSKPAPSPKPPGEAAKPKGKSDPGQRQDDEKKKGKNKK